MSNRMDNLELVFERTDWAEFTRNRNALFITNESLPDSELQALLYWLDCIEAAAKMDGYQVDPKEKDTTQ